MKKLLIFLITIFSISIFPGINVYAESANFYEGEYIPGIWITKQTGNTKHYQTARFFNRVGDNKFSYCIEPFAMFNETSTYTSTITPANLSNSQKEWISLLARFGYGYKDDKYDHTNKKWYAITQYMIWNEASPQDDIYFTDKLNGNKVNIYTEEQNNIRNTIYQYKKLPSIANTEINLLEGKSITLNDTNEVLNKFQSNNANATINNNSLTINNLKEGTYEINLTKEDHEQSVPPVYYTSSSSQDMMVNGKFNTLSTKIKVNVYKTEINITKIDANTKTTTPSGEASLVGAEYNLYDKDMNFITKVVIGKDSTAKIENIKLGKYYLQEIKAGTGYTLDEKLHEINITMDTKVIDLKLENKVIERKIEINKEYGKENNFQKEPNVSFDIYNNLGLYKTITTNDNGYAFAILPYGKYIIKQKNTTPGYTLSNDININVDSNKQDVYNLYDYKIKVPNTKTSSNGYLYLLLFPIYGLGYAFKKQVI